MTRGLVKLYRTQKQSHREVKTMVKDKTKEYRYHYDTFCVGVFESPYVVIRKYIKYVDPQSSPSRLDPTQLIRPRRLKPSKRVCRPPVGRKPTTYHPSRPDQVETDTENRRTIFVLRLDHQIRVQVPSRFIKLTFGYFGELGSES